MFLRRILHDATGDTTSQQMWMLRALAFCAALPSFALGYTNSGAFVHLFEWSWSDVAQECENWLGPKGYSGIQVSPPTEHIQGSEWWTRYQPVSYNFTSRSGTEEEFRDMVARCNKVGVDIIVDAVFNQMAAGSGTGIAGSSYGNRAYNTLYTQDDFHHYSYDSSKNCVINDYTSKDNVQLCDLSGMPDLCTGCSHTQSQISSYLSNAVSMGVQGFRIDAAKHQDAAELGTILNTLPSSVYTFQEVIDGGSQEAVQPEMYFGNGQVTEFNYATEVDNNIIAYNKIVYFQSFGEAWGLIPEEYAVVFLDNHDTQRGNAQLTYKNGDLYTFANIFMLAHPYGFPKVMSSFYFTDTDQGPPSTPVYDGNTVHCTDGSTWVCEHRWTPIANMVAWRKTAGTADIANWQNGNANQIAFSRGGAAFVAMNRDSYSWSITLQTGLPSGQYCNVISSDDTSTCSTVNVNSGGTASITVPALSAVALHKNKQKS